MKVVGCGDNIVDRFIDRRITYPGGNCVNFAVFASQLGAESHYVGAFGSDPHGDHIRAALTAEGVRLDHSVVREGVSGVTDITVVDGERVFGGWNGGGVSCEHPRRVDDTVSDFLRDARVVHSSVYSRLEAELPRMRGRDTLVSYDLSSEPEYRTSEYLDLVCPHIDLALISASEVSEADTITLMRRVVDAGSGAALATRGTAGSFLLWDGSIHRGEAEVVDAAAVRDTMGCGDAFVTAFVVALLRDGWTRTLRPHPAAALAFAASFAARQVQVEGAFGHGVAY